MNCNYLTLGQDCSPSDALRRLNLREFALPFDWIVSSINILEKCFQTNFLYFHKNLVLNNKKTRLIDHYGFQFPHDYPLSTMENVENHVGEGIFGEEKGKIITNKWSEYYDVVLEKYNRRIERFNKIVNDTKPIIVLCRYDTKDVLKLQNLLKKYYKLDNVYFVNSSRQMFENDKIINVHTEKNKIWNDITIWRIGIDIILKKIYPM